MSCHTAICPDQTRGNQIYNNAILHFAAEEMFAAANACSIEVERVAALDTSLSGRCLDDAPCIYVSMLAYMLAYIPSLFQDVHSMWCFMWQEHKVLMSVFIQGAMRMMRADS